MNYNMLTNKEILRIADPETDLEKRLFTLVDDMENNEDSMNHQLSCEIGGLEDKVRGLESRIVDQDDAINDQGDNIKRLEKLLDDNNIEHDEALT